MLTMKTNFSTSLLVAISFLAAPAIFAQATITVDVDKPGHPVSPLLWGIFFEDINLSADGGIYPELVRNRSFEDAARPEYWRLLNFTNCVTVRWPLMILRPAQSVQPSQSAGESGRRVHAGKRRLLGHEHRQWRRLCVQVRGARDEWLRTATVKSIVGAARDEVLADGKISGLGDHWKYHSLDLVAPGSDPKAKLQISGDGKGTLFLDMVSLMPKKTWKNHGLRAGSGGIARRHCIRRSCVFPAAAGWRAMISRT